MNSLQKAAHALGSQATYLPEEKRLQLNEKPVSAVSENHHLYAEIQLDNQRFRLPMASGNVLIRFLKSVADGKIALLRMDDCHLKLAGWNNLEWTRRELNHRRHHHGMHPFFRVLCCLLGIPATIFGAILAVVSIAGFPFPSEYLSILPIGLAIAALGFGLTHHGVVKEPCPLPQALSYGMGVAFSGFGAAMLGYTYLSPDADLSRSDRYGMTFLFAIIVTIGVFLIQTGLQLFEKGTGKNAVTILKRVPDMPPAEQLNALLQAIEERTRISSLTMILAPEESPALTDSKLGGLPYWEPDRPLLLDAQGNPMRLLAQINLASLPPTELPATGILQFFLCCDDGDCFPENGKVIWHPEIDPAITPESIATRYDVQDPEWMPFSGECAIRFLLREVSMELDDNTTRKILDAIAEAQGLQLDPTLTLEELRPPQDETSASGSHLLGYPYFIQFDPRSGSDEVYNRLLFQLESEGGSFPIMWGDCGVGAFFIPQADLEAHCFDNVYFTWDSC